VAKLFYTGAELDAIIEEAEAGGEVVDPRELASADAPSSDAGLFARANVTATAAAPMPPGTRPAKELTRGLTLAQLRARDAEELGLDDEDEDYEDESDPDEGIEPDQLLAEIEETLALMERIERRSKR
jgi:hypothetical protein